MSDCDSEWIATLPAPMHAQDQARRKAIQVEIGHRLRAYRHRRSLSLRDIAGEIGISIQMVAKYEHGQSSPYVSVLHAICRVLGVTITDLLEGIDVDQPRQGNWTAGLLRVGDRDAVERLALFDLFERIPDNTLRRLLLKTVVHLAETSQPRQHSDAPELAGQAQQ